MLGRRTVGTTRVVPGGRLRPGQAARIVFIVLYLGFLLLPLYWVAVTSIKPQEDLLADPPVWWPQHPSGLHYSTALHAFREQRQQRLEGQAEEQRNETEHEQPE